jgi:CheY-like chemotaxis protein
MMPSCIQVSSAALVDNGFELALSKPITITGLSETLCQLFPLTDPTDTENDSSTEMFPATTRILLVDDDQINHLVGESILELFGLTADFAFNGIEALEKLRMSSDSEPYTIVLMDCQMPEMDGYETSRAIRAGQAGERYKKVSMIAMTGSTLELDREKCLAAGFSDYLPKPVQEEELLIKLKGVVNS